MTPSRKRGRNSPEDETEFMPLSKRINNLHINSSLLLEQQKGPAMSMINEALGLAPFLSASSCLPESPPLSVQSVEWNLANPAPYNPELTETQNPFYYSSNKLLYEMYVARQERSSQ